MKILNIYTDGSHIDKLNNGRLGCGGIAVDPVTQKQIGEFSQELIPSYLKVRYGTDKCSNPSAELLGVYCALIYFKPILNKYDQIIIKSDYILVYIYKQKSHLLRWLFCLY